MSASKETRFSFNWNNKLSNRSFTTIRLFNERKYKPGEIHAIILRTKNNVVTLCGDAEILESRKIYGRDFNEFIAQIDTGYSLKEMKGILGRMYSNKDIESTAFSFVLFRYLPNTAIINKKKKK